MREQKVRNMGKGAKKKNKKVAVPKANIQELNISRDGGQIALRGYSYQFLYSCYLILSSSSPDISFQLEGIEDILTNCAWIDGFPVELEWLRQNEILLKVADKFPKIDYVGKYSKFLKHIIPENNEIFCSSTLLK